MDRSEALAERYFRSIGFMAVVFRPDGHGPPDFLLQGEIAVEVRRLNQNFDSGKEVRGLEEVEAPLLQRMQRLMASFGPSIAGESWFVSYSFGRPVEPWPTLEPKLRSAMERVIGDPDPSNRCIYSSPSFTLDAGRASNPHPTLFLLGGYSDHQAGGFVIAEMLKNIEHCLAEKSLKRANAKSAYDRWWLLLVDTTGFGIDEENTQELLRHVQRSPDWEKVIVLRSNGRVIEF